MSTIALLLLLQQPAPQEKMEWNVDKGKSLSFAWSYSEKHEVTKGDVTTTRLETRDVKGSASPPKDMPVKTFGMLELTLRDITWVVKEPGFEAKIVKSSGGVKPELTVGDSDAAKARFKTMEEHAATEYRLRVDSTTAQLGCVRMGAFDAGRDAAGLFQRAFVHAPWTTDLRENVKWTVKLDDVPAVKDTGVSEMEMRIIYKAGDKITGSGEVRAKWKHPSDDTVTGTIYVRRKLDWIRKGHLGLAEEEVKLTRDGLGEKVALTILSKLTLK